jgi:trimeric autotransporter adhesin
MNKATYIIAPLTLFVGGIALPQAAWADATPQCNEGARVGSTECGRDSVAIGDFATALGNAIAEGNGTTAIGARSEAEAENSVALGYGAYTNEVNVVSIGSAGSRFPVGPLTRRIVNVSDGINATDGATVGQMNAANALQNTRMTAIEAVNTVQNTRITDVETVNATQDTRLNGIDALNIAQNSRLTSLEALSAASVSRLSALESGFGALAGDVLRNRAEARRGIAAAVALTAAPMPSAPGKTSYSFNLATYRSEQAASISFAHRLNSEDPVALTFGFSHAGKKDTAARVGIAGEF